MTNVKNTTPNTLVAFCSSRMMRPCRDEFRDITLELREWWDRMVVVRCNRHGDDGALLALGMSPLIILLWLRNVAERRNGGVGDGTFVGVKSNDVRAPPKLEPRRWFRRMSHVTIEFDLV